MDNLDITDVTFGFKGPKGSWERRFTLLLIHISSRIRQAWFWLRGLIGAAIFVGILAANWQPSASTFGWALGLASFWFAFLWALSPRYRVAALDVPEALSKKGLDGSVLARRIMIEARPLLDAVQEPHAPPAIELLPPPVGNIPGLKVTFAQIGDLIQEARRLPPKIIAGEIVEVGTNAFLVRFSLERESRFEEIGPFEADRLTDIAPEAAQALIRLSAPFHAALSAYFSGNRRDAYETAIAAARHDRVPVRTRAACWCLLALGWAADGKVDHAALALRRAESLDPWYPVTSLLVYQLLGTKMRQEHPSVETRKEIRDARDWYFDLGMAGSGTSSLLFAPFFSVLAKHEVREGKLKMLHNLESEISKAEARMEGAIQEGPTAAIRLYDYAVAKQRIEEALQDLSQRYLPGFADSRAYREVYERISQKISRIVARVPKHKETIESLERSKKPDVELSAKFLEDMKTADPDFYEEYVRREEEIRQNTEASAAQLKALRNMIDEIDNNISSKLVEIEKRQKVVEGRTNYLKKMEGTPFED